VGTFPVGKFPTNYTIGNNGSFIVTYPASSFSAYGQVLNVVVMGSTAAGPFSVGNPFNVTINDMDDPNVANPCSVYAQWQTLHTTCQRNVGLLASLCRSSLLTTITFCGAGPWDPTNLVGNIPSSMSDSCFNAMRNYLTTCAGKFYGNVFTDKWATQLSMFMLRYGLAPGAATSLITPNMVNNIVGRESYQVSTVATYVDNTVQKLRPLPATCNTLYQTLLANCPPGLTSCADGYIPPFGPHSPPTHSFSTCGDTWNTFLGQCLIPFWTYLDFPSRRQVFDFTASVQHLLVVSSCICFGIVFFLFFFFVSRPNLHHQFDIVSKQN
jgi:hypothetical protein